MSPILHASGRTRIWGPSVIGHFSYIKKIAIYVWGYLRTVNFCAMEQDLEMRHDAVLFLFLCHCLNLITTNYQTHSWNGNFRVSPKCWILSAPLEPFL